MFIEMFAASTLAVVLFGGRTEQKDYSYNFDRLSTKLDKIDSKLDAIADTQAFMKARSCLENFSPMLLDGIELSYKHHTLQDIMEAAEEGFNMLCKTACADENNFLEARKIFKNTWGNTEWVNNKFGKQIDEWTDLISTGERAYNETAQQYKEYSEKLTNAFYELVHNTPTKKTFFKRLKIDEVKTKQMIEDLVILRKSAPKMSTTVLEYLDLTHKTIDVKLDLSRVNNVNERLFGVYIERSYFLYEKVDFAVEMIYKVYMKDIIK